MHPKVIERRIPKIIGQDNRNCKKEPFTQQELLAIIETFEYEMSNPEIKVDLGNFYNECVNFLKIKLLLV